jgi:hypothetical protein
VFGQLLKKCVNLRNLFEAILSNSTNSNSSNCGIISLYFWFGYCLHCFLTLNYYHSKNDIITISGLTDCTFFLYITGTEQTLMILYSFVLLYFPSVLLLLFRLNFKNKNNAKSGICVKKIIKNIWFMI